MPEKLWDTDADWAEWTLVHLEIASGAIQVAEGYTSGTATSPVYNAVDFAHEGEAAAEEVQVGVGCNVYARFRSGATQNECLAADWSPWFDVVYTDGTCIVDTGSYYLNNVDVPMGQYWQIEVLLRRD